MKTFKEIKEKLQEEARSTEYFTEDFFSAFIKERKEAFEGDKEAASCYAETKQSDFYRKNGCAYCEFLSIFNDSLNKYRIDFFDKTDTFYYTSLLERVYQNFMSEEEARTWAKSYRPDAVCEINLSL